MAVYRDGHSAPSSQGKLSEPMVDSSLSSLCTDWTKGHFKFALGKVKEDLKLLSVGSKEGNWFIVEKDMSVAVLVCEYQRLISCVFPHTHHQVTNKTNTSCTWL